GIRDRNVTGVQTCALPICLPVLQGFLAAGDLAGGRPGRRCKMKGIPRLIRDFLLAMAVLTFFCWKLDALRTPVVETTAPFSGSLDRKSVVEGKVVEYGGGV